MPSIRWFCVMGSVSALLGVACSTDTTGTSQGAGGTPSESGGQMSAGAGAGGTLATGGVVATGGTVGGTSGTGGAVGSGGRSGTGGTSATTSTTPATGGQVASGGTVGAGGRSETGGSTSTTPPGAGGQPGSGGTVAAGGSAGRDAGRDGPTGNGGASTGGTSGTGSGGSPAVDAGTTPTGGAGGASAGCGSTNTTSPCGVKGTTCSLDVSGTARTYYVQLPSSYSASKPYPLIFQFHPWGGSADQALTMYQLNSKIPDAIYVTPQGLQAGSNGAGWANTNGQDIAFTKAMLADVQGKYCVDNARIFSTGFSYGGMMSFAIGCEMSDVFRAIAPMSGSLYSDFNCKGTGPHIAMWGSHGLSDTVVPIDDGRAARDKILQENHCSTTTVAVDPSPCVKYQGCDPGYDVTWCEWDGPHGIPSFGSAAIAAFFKQF
jgi:polyhydroxybutyrate depolymerase